MKVLLLLSVEFYVFGKEEAKNFSTSVVLAAAMIKRKAFGKYWLAAVAADSVV
jgi:hypothetical protein